MGPASRQIGFMLLNCRWLVTSYWLVILIEIWLLNRIKLFRQICIYTVDKWWSLAYWCSVRHPWLLDMGCSLLLPFSCVWSCSPWPLRYIYEYIWVMSDDIHSDHIYIYMHVWLLFPCWVSLDAIDIGWSLLLPFCCVWSTGLLFIYIYTNQWWDYTCMHTCDQYTLCWAHVNTRNQWQLVMSSEAPLRLLDKCVIMTNSEVVRLLYIFLNLWSSGFLYMFLDQGKFTIVFNCVRVT